MQQTSERPCTHKVPYVKKHLQMSVNIGSQRLFERTVSALRVLLSFP